VDAAANCLGPVAFPASSIVAASMAILPNGTCSISFLTENGKSQTVQYKNALTDPAWTDLETVAGTGGKVSVTDADAAGHSLRFYRVIPATQ
jgi:hypothetical protein